jgi:phosphate starvation-inducible membrane PsiE
MLCLQRVTGVLGMSEGITSMEEDLLTMSFYFLFLVLIFSPATYFNNQGHMSVDTSISLGVQLLVFIMLDKTDSSLTPIISSLR